MLEVRTEQPPLKVARKGGREAGEPGSKLQDGTTPDIVLDRVLTKLALHKTTPAIALLEAAISAPAVPHSTQDHRGKARRARPGKCLDVP